MARLRPSQRRALLERLAAEGPTAHLDPTRPVYLVSEQMPPINDTVKVWFADGIHGSSGRWLGNRWDLREGGYGDPVKWQPIKPLPRAPTGDVHGLRSRRADPLQ